jgi:hypothetical protein
LIEQLADGTMMPQHGLRLAAPGYSGGSVTAWRGDSMDKCLPLPDLREADLTGPVRRALASQDVIPTEWQLQPLGGGRGDVTGGVYRVVGCGQDQGHPVSWSLVLKVVPEPNQDEDPAAYNYWKREFCIYQAGLLADLPGITAPRCWGVCDRPGQGTLLWLEDIADVGQQAWHDHDYAQAARNLGVFNAAHLNNRTLPRGAWLSDQMLRKGCDFFAPYMRDLPTTLDHSLVRQACSPTQANRLERLWAAREALLAKVEDLPQTFCHFDAIQRNLHHREGMGAAQTIAFDWEWGGVGALGEDLAPLVAGTLCMGDIHAASAERLDAVAFSGYLDGLFEAGWRGDAAQVRFAYCAASALRYGLWGAWLAGRLADEHDGHAEVAAFFARPVGAVVQHYALLLPLLLDHADEAQAALEASPKGLAGL